MRHSFLIAGALMAAVSLSSCAASKKNKTNSSMSTNVNDLKQKWMVKEIRGGDKELLMKKGAHITFNKEDSRGGANFGCNGMGFDYTIPAPGKIRFGPVMSTMMFCEGITPMESAFSQGVKDELSYEIKGHFLYLKDSKGVFLTAVRPDWD